MNKVVADLVGIIKSLFSVAKLFDLGMFIFFAVLVLSTDGFWMEILVCSGLVCYGLFRVFN